MGATSTLPPQSALCLLRTRPPGWLLAVELVRKAVELVWTGVSGPGVLFHPGCLPGGRGEPEQLMELRAWQGHMGGTGLLPRKFQDRRERVLMGDMRTSVLGLSSSTNGSPPS